MFLRLNFIKNIRVGRRILLRAYKKKIILIRSIFAYTWIKYIAPKDKIILIYDENTNPITYGDFLYFPLLGKALLNNAGFKKISLLYIESKDSSNKKKFREECMALSKKICPQIEFTKCETLENPEKKNILFYRKVIRNVSIYIYLFNLLNIVYLFNKDRSFLLAKDLNAQISKKINRQEFACLHVRYNEFYGQDRNITQDDYILLTKSIYTKYKYPIVLISDQSGTDFCKKIKLDPRIDVVFAKDYCKEFIDDIEIVLQCKMYFQYRGGGMGVIPMFSEVPYRICDSAANEYQFKKNNLCSWAHSNQIRVHSSRIDRFLEIV